MNTAREKSLRKTKFKRNANGFCGLIIVQVLRSFNSSGGDGESAADAGADEQLETDERRRERLLDDMLALTRQWRDQSIVAGKVIKKDIQVESGFAQ